MDYVAGNGFLITDSVKNVPTYCHHCLLFFVFVCIYLYLSVTLSADNTFTCICGLWRLVGPIYRFTASHNPPRLKVRGARATTYLDHIGTESRFEVSHDGLSKNVFGFILQEELHRFDIFTPLAQSVVHDVDLSTIQDARLYPGHGHFLINLINRSLNQAKSESFHDEILDLVGGQTSFFLRFP